jgi:hypothetical protein
MQTDANGYNQICLSSDLAHLAVDAPVIVLYFSNCVRFPAILAMSICRMDDALKTANKELGSLFGNSSSSTNNTNSMSALNDTMNKTASGN